MDGAVRSADAYQNAALISGDRQVVRTAAERHFPLNLSTFSVHDIEHALRFVADIDSRAVGREGNSMRQLNARNHLHDFICRGIDDIDCVCTSIGYLNRPDTVWRKSTSTPPSSSPHPAASP